MCVDVCECVRSGIGLILRSPWSNTPVGRRTGGQPCVSCRVVGHCRSPLQTSGQLAGSSALTVASPSRCCGTGFGGAPPGSGSAPSTCKPIRVRCSPPSSGIPPSGIIPMDPFLARAAAAAKGAGFWPPPQVLPTVYTDGSCVQPKDLLLRCAAWAAVGPAPRFEVVAQAPVFGEQTIGRPYLGPPVPAGPDCR
jgi:hypothetical protein